MMLTPNQCHDYRFPVFILFSPRLEGPRLNFPKGIPGLVVVTKNGET